MWWIVGFIILAVGICLVIYAARDTKDNDTQEVSVLLGSLLIIVLSLTLPISRSIGIKENDTEAIEKYLEKFPDKTINDIFFISQYADVYIKAGIILCMTIIIIFIFRHKIKNIFSSKEDKQYRKIIKKINELDNIISKIKSEYAKYGKYGNIGVINNDTKKYIELLEKTKTKLENDVMRIYINEGIQIAKNIELQNSAIDIQRELDELEALQQLNNEENNY